MLNFKLYQKKSSSIFLNIFLPFFLCMLIFLIILSYTLYSNFERIALKIVYDFQKNDLRSISHNLSNMLDTAKALSIDAFFDSDISNLLYYENLEPNIYQKAQLRLQSYKNSNPFLYSIYVYNGSHIFIEPSAHYDYNKDTVPDGDILTILSNMKMYPSHSLIPRKLTVDIPGDKIPKYVYSYLFYDSQMRSGKISEAIILNISENWLRSNIDSLKKNNNNRIFIIDGQGRLVISDINFSMLTDLSSYKYIREILSSGDSSNFLRTNVDGDDSFVAYVKTGISNYTFISITPYSDIVGDIQAMKKITYFIVFLIALIVVFIVLLLSQRLYNPIKSIVQKLNFLESESKRTFFNRKQEYLTMLVKDSYTLNIEELEINFKYFNIKLKHIENLLLLILKIDNFSSFCDNYNLGNRNLMKIRIMSISSELCSPTFENECIDMGEDHIILLINFNNPDSSQNNVTFMQLIQSIQDNIQKQLQISISITISEIFEDIKMLNNLYGKTLYSSCYRLILGHRCVIFANQPDQFHISDFKYPIDREKQILEHLKLGHCKDAEEVLSDIFGYASAYGFTALNTTILRFLISLGNTIETLKFTNDFISNYNLSTLPNRLNKLETLDEIKNMFSDIFNKACTQSEQNTEIKHQKLLNTVIEIINKEYSRHDLSLNIISERLDISPSYLSRLFKKYKVHSMVDYVNMVRIEKAKELLITTNEPISEIMDKTGFTSRSHFYTLFKKTYGFSPGNIKFSNKLNNSNQ